MKCDRCRKEHDGSFGSGRFCSSACAYTREHSEEANQKRSKAMKGHHYNKGQVPWNKGKRVSEGRGYFATNKIPVQDVLDGRHPNMSSYDVRNKLLVEGILKDACMECGWSKKRPGYRFSTCQLHHKNGNKKDHRLDNLELLCPNCHSLTLTFCKSKASVGRAPRRTFDSHGKATRLGNPKVV